MPVTSPAIVPPPKRPRANSKGEELFLIHLKRTAGEDSDDDHDHDKPRKPKKTIGEELYEVHLKRSKGLEPDYDVDVDVDPGVKNSPVGNDAISEGKAHYNLRARKSPTTMHH
jgi:hypothetical protein